MAQESLKAAKSGLELFEIYRLEKESVFEKLEKEYKERLKIEEPAKFWETIGDERTTRWRIWLVVFSVLVAIPLIVLIWCSSEFASWVAKISSGANGAISLAGVAALTIPAILYGWLLRSVSRLFTQNLTLADDAAHRRALALTYLGLIANDKTEITKEDRLLILNALFRALPTTAPDDGPPSALVELISGKGKS